MSDDVPHDTSLQDRPPGDVLRGRVKWFDPAKGFGFVLADIGGPDILLHANVLRSFGQNSIADGTGVEVEVVETERGRQALRIIGLLATEFPAPAALPDLAALDPETQAALPIQPARVKWFDKAKGFGFANIFGFPADVFIHIEVLRQSGLGDLVPGEALGLRVIDGRRGKMAVEVLSWDQGTDQDDAGS